MGAVELLRRGVADHARALAGWCAGIVACAALVAAIFPSIEGSAEFDELVESYPEVLQSLFGLEGADLSTGAGFLDVELFSLMLPLLVIVLAIGSGARALAGEEEAGRLELLLAYPVRRRDAVLWKGAAVAAEVLAACAAAFVALAVLDPVLGLELSPARSPRRSPAWRPSGCCTAGWRWAWARPSPAASSRSRCRPGWPPRATSWAASTGWRDGSTRSGSPRRSGGSARPPCRKGCAGRASRSSRGPAWSR